MTYMEPCKDLYFSSLLKNLEDADTNVRLVITPNIKILNNNQSNITYFDSPHSG